ncbi:ABC transporter ATP-binding protein [Lederbergia lenta]|uniref:Iron ABC transporter permease n=1 Tax=Lederbergia lenta TaxID=1467 RepID=A0A2X4WJL2_LEDLE|nr:ABC transporter ATP-binding protein [Lederbergia lenta]MEC2323257.1 ABC transporter ATP-binding protein [Lederbergia lenta]SQI63079.1 iron ABC transporter permease [Lederbergia lenta]
MLDVKGVSGGYPGNSVLNDVSFSVKGGELFGILGPNGSGKTTLLKMISGLLAPHDGEVLIKNRALSTFSAKELAKKVAVLPQVSSEVFAYTVKETVSLGRYAHQSGWFHSRHHDDEVLIEEAMETTGVAKFQHKLLHELSGGERQRVFLAQALAQQPEILLLDEPTNHLDLAYQKDLLDQLKNWTRERGIAVVSIFHDLNLAGLYCDRLLLLNEGEVELLGKPPFVLQESSIRQVYQTKVVKQFHPHVPQPQMLLVPETKQIDESIRLGELFLKRTEASVEYHSPVALKMMATQVGIGWHRSVIATNVLEHKQNEAICFYMEESIHKLRTGTLEEDRCSAFIVTNSELTWIFVDGYLSDGAFIDIMTKIAATKGAINLVIAATQIGKLINIDTFTEKIITYLRYEGS